MRLQLQIKNWSSYVFYKYVYLQKIKLNFKLIPSTCNYMKHFFNKQLTSYLKKIIVVSKVFLYIILQNNIIFIYNLSLIDYLILSSFFQILNYVKYGKIKDKLNLFFLQLL